MGMFVSGADGDDASVGDFADRVLELDGGVMNVEARPKLVANLAQQGLAFGGAHVGDADVAGERMSIAADAPDVQIVDVVDSGDGANGGFDALQFHAARRAFEQDVEALADDADGRPEDHDADADGEGGIDPALSGKRDGDTSGDDGGGGERVADFVHDGATQVDVAMAAHEQQCDAAVHDHTGGGDPDHQLRVDIDRVQEAAKGFVPDVKRDQDERGSIDERRQNAGAVVAESLAGIGTFAR